MTLLCSKPRLLEKVGGNARIAQSVVQATFQKVLRGHAAIPENVLFLNRPMPGFHLSNIPFPAMCGPGPPMEPVALLLGGTDKASNSEASASQLQFLLVGEDTVTPLST
jgi:hypothetical protein